jgi:UDP-hydrolysing UDP-N-acetyl-D-glucosamine 2-epimerase
MEELKAASDFELQTLVTGAHFSPEYGDTYREIERDGFAIDARIEMLLSSGTAVGIAKSMGLCGIGVADAFDRMRPDLLLVLGDRYELLPICSTALVMRIPIAHLSGGDITEGAIDDEVRNAVTQMASVHFPGTAGSARRVISMGAHSDRVFAVGESGLDNFRRLPKIDRDVLAHDLGLDPSKKWILFTYHPETKLDMEANLGVLEASLLSSLRIEGCQILATYANSDFGGSEINRRLEALATTSSGRLIVKKNLGQLRYTNMLRHAALMVGNSSSGIYETQIVRLPVVNIGNRQTGRFKPENIVDCIGDAASVSAAIKKALDINFLASIAEIPQYYGDGRTAERIIEILRGIEFKCK